MSTSINGWDVIESQSDPRLAVGVVPGTRIKLRARKEFLPLVLALAADYHKEVAPLRAGECGVYAFRKALQGGGLYSDHASGTAADLNWGHEGAMGAKGGMKTMTDAQIKACAEIKKRYKIVIWGGDAAKGGDYKDAKSWDPMHFALKPKTTVVNVNKVIAELGIDKNGVRKGVDVKKPSILTKLTTVVRAFNKTAPVVAKTSTTKTKGTVK
ncbi:MAG: hypothetical protein EBY26_00285 [Microbacteriaceae bacterium]|nr:hypothetical protein [Microbacteriaceae bacterium]